MSKRDILDDYLDEDPEIPSQRVVLVSFLSPERILEDKTKWMFRQFLKDYDLKWKTTKFEAWLAGQISEINDKIDAVAGKLKEKGHEEESKELQDSHLAVYTVVESFQEFCRKETKDLSKSTLAEEYDDFLFKNQQKLEDEFHAKNEFRTTMRGVKVRGVYATEAEAAARAQRLQKADPNFNIYAGAVGKWLAWDPDPNKIKDQVYAEEQLNTLMKKYRENEEERDQFYNEQKKRRTAKKQAEERGEELKPIEISVTDASGVPVTDAAAADSAPPLAVPSGGAPVGSYDGMFSGPADLVIQRKMEAAATAVEKVVEAVVEEKKETAE